MSKIHILQFVSLLMIIFFISMFIIANYQESQEITSEQYDIVQTWITDYPEMKPLIKKDILDDGYIDIYEYKKLEIKAEKYKKYYELLKDKN